MSPDKKSSPTKKTKTSINPELYAPKKVSFVSIFARHVLPYYDYLDKCCRLMCQWCTSMSKIWKKNEEKLMKEKMFTRRTVQVTDELFETHKLDPENLYFSFYILDIVQIDLKKNFDKVLGSVLKAIQTNASVEYRKRYIEFFRIW